MKSVFAALLCSVCFGASLQARCATLPDACGNDGVKFDVATQKDHTAPTPPTAGKARIVMIETSDYVSPGSRATARIGMDGAWVGANKGNSYFAFDVTPGLHHLCANWQSSFKGLDKQVELAPVNAEPGKVYYFLVKVKASKYFEDFTLAPLNVDEATYLIQISALSTSKPIVQH
jgi:hypothetical protein